LPGVKFVGAMALFPEAELSHFNSKKFSNNNIFGAWPGYYL
jgi:hypothetical protein